MEEIEEKGVTILSNVYTTNQLLNFHEQYNREWGDIYVNLEKAVWKKINYKHQDTPTFFLDKALYQGKEIATFGENIVYKLGKGRCNFDCKLDLDQFLTPEIQAIIDHFLKRNYTTIIGGMPLSPGAEDGGWHRDIGSLYEDESVDLAVPPFYMTMIIPLTNVNIGQGCTEFVLGSHLFNFNENGIKTKQQLDEWITEQPRLQAEMCAGDVCIFSGLTLHRGTFNGSDKQRDAIFIVFRKNWYSDDNPSDYFLE